MRCVRALVFLELVFTVLRTVNCLDYTRCLVGPRSISGNTFLFLPYVFARPSRKTARRMKMISPLS
jgi:hypothetical protein